MNDVASSLASIVAEALALMHDLDGAAPTGQIRCIERAWRLRLAAETCHLSLASSSPPRGTPIRPSPRPSGKHVLSRRELQVLQLIAAGHRDRQIADALLVSPRTVTTHVSAILNKLGAESRIAAVVYAIRAGLV
jgi:DNA-binding NarL/FixJ family response regulator